MKMEPAPGVPVYGIVVEKDVDVPMRDGARLKADVFRPDDPGTFPAILNLGPYQKDKLWVRQSGGKAEPADELFYPGTFPKPARHRHFPQQRVRNPRHIRVSCCNVWTRPLHVQARHTLDGTDMRQRWESSI